MNATTQDALGGIFLAVMSCGMGYAFGSLTHFISLNYANLGGGVSLALGLIVGVATVVVYYWELN